MAESYYQRNLEQQRVYRRKWRAKNKAKVKAANQRSYAKHGQRYKKLHRERRHTHTHKCKNYGITPEQYASLLASQSGLCAICKQPETMIIKGKVCDLTIDHDHVTGLVRGLLCSQCNKGLGCFKDNPALLLESVNYLQASV
jgi:hypothetical protein